MSTAVPVDACRISPSLLPSFLLHPNSNTFTIHLRAGKEEIMRKFNVRDIRLVKFEAEITKHGRESHVEFGVGKAGTRRFISTPISCKWRKRF
jgi:hypothetical protein